MVVFGHRRLRAAKQLGRNVRAVVKEMKDREHVITQGQENSARANLSFIEKAILTAANLARLHYDEDNAVIIEPLSGLTGQRSPRCCRSRRFRVGSFNQLVQRKALGVTVGTS